MILNSGCTHWTHDLRLQVKISSTVYYLGSLFHVCFLYSKIWVRVRLYALPSPHFDKAVGCSLFCLALWCIISLNFFIVISVSVLHRLWLSRKLKIPAWIKSESKFLEIMSIDSWSPPGLMQTCTRTQRSFFMATRTVSRRINALLCLKIALCY